MSHKLATYIPIVSSSLLIDVFLVMKEARALFMGLMRENPSFGRAYFDGFSQEKPVVVGIGADGVQFLDATDGDRPVLAEYGFDSIGSFVCSDEVHTHDMYST